jgi:kynurenine formamidase
MIEIATLEEFRAVSNRVRNWGRWGADDECGTLNFITEKSVRRASDEVREGKVFSLGASFDSAGPGGVLPMRPNPQHFVTIGGDYDAHVAQFNAGATEPKSAFFDTAFGGDGLMRFNDDVLVLPLQCCTQWDALSHVYYDGMMYNGFPASAVSALGAARLGIDKVADRGIVGRGVLVDIPRFRGVDVLDAAEPVMPDELDAALAAQGVAIESGDILLLRTGAWEKFQADQDATALTFGSSGLSWRCAEWLHEREISAVAADNIQVETTAQEVENGFLALHLLCLRDMGMMFGEMWNLRELSAACAADGRYAFQIVAPPLRVTGGIGSPLNPIALR